jgi:hypothetical protein
MTVTVLAALYANACPACGRKHRSPAFNRPTAIMAAHATQLTAQGYLGYDYDREAWVKS